ncbi:hypothetical protein J7L70_03215 [Candidatus Bathyarchaeota archaeon]|nr:hypothetical protein [Candidatus Bathyarchaeota archaeon]
MSRVKTLSEAMVSYFIAFMIWLFTLFVFIPLAEEIVVEPPLRAIVAFIGLLGMAHSTYRGSVLLLEYRKSLANEPKNLIKLGIIETIIILDGVLVIPIVWKISSIIGGLTLIAFIAVAFFHLLTSIQE